MGTEPARPQERLEAALGPAWGIERELAGGGKSRVFLINDARLGPRIVSKVPRPHVVPTLTEVGTAAYLVAEQVTGDPAMDQCADLSALGMMAYGLLVGSHPFAGRHT